MTGRIAHHTTMHLALCLCIGTILDVSTASGQTATDVNVQLRELRKDIDALSSGQQDIQKTLQAIRDLLMGKQPPLEDMYISTSSAQSQGDPHAKVVMMEFSDFECPFCGRYATETYSKIIDAFVKTGKVRYYVRNFPIDQLHPLAEKAAEAAECAADQAKYWEMHDRLFQNQSSLDVKQLAVHAAAVGLDQPRFEQCLESGKYQAKVKSDQAEGLKASVRGTPTFFFGYSDDKDPAKLKAVQMLSGAQPLSEFTQILEKLLNPPQDTVVR